MIWLLVLIIHPVNKMVWLGVGRYVIPYRFFHMVYRIENIGMKKIYIDTETRFLVYKFYLV